MITGVGKQDWQVWQKCALWLCHEAAFFALHWLRTNKHGCTPRSPNSRQTKPKGKKNYTSAAHIFTLLSVTIILRVCKWKLQLYVFSAAGLTWVFWQATDGLSSPPPPPPPTWPVVLYSSVAGQRCGVWDHKWVYFFFKLGGGGGRWTSKRWQWGKAGKYVLSSLYNIK